MRNGAIGCANGLYSRKSAPPSLHEDVGSLTRRALSSSPRHEAKAPSLCAHAPYYKGKLFAIPSLGPSIAAAEKFVIIPPKKFKTMIALPAAAPHAITIHKPQILALPKAAIDPSGAFVRGAIYIALSRAPSLHRIFLLKPLGLEAANKHRPKALHLLKSIQAIKQKSQFLSISEIR